MSEKEEWYPKKFGDWFYLPKLDSFNVRWFLIFLVLYIIPFLPTKYTFPWKEYVPWFFGFPAFICMNIFLGLVGGILFTIFYYQVIKRGFIEEEGDLDEKEGER